VELPDINVRDLQKQIADEDHPPIILPQGTGTSHPPCATEDGAVPSSQCQHFIRDIGLIFLFVGTAFLLGAARPQYRVVLWAAPTLWLAVHARSSTSGRSPPASARRRRSCVIFPRSRSPRSSVRACR
jgi:hypothetical protein